LADNKLLLMADAGLERVVRNIKPEQAGALLGLFYDMPDAVLLLDSNYKFFFASREAERQLGYKREDILLDSRRFQSEVFSRLKEVCCDQFDRLKKQDFELKGVGYSSTDSKYNFLFNVRVEKLGQGGAMVRLMNVSRAPYHRMEEDVTVVATKFLDKRSDWLWPGDKKGEFVGKLMSEYINATPQERRIIIDLTKTCDISEGILDLLIELQEKDHRILFLNPKPEIYEKLHKNGKGVPETRLCYAVPAAV